MHSAPDCGFAAVNEATAIKTTEHLTAGLKRCRVNRTRVDRYKLAWSFKKRQKEFLCWHAHFVNSA